MEARSRRSLRWRSLGLCLVAGLLAGCGSSPAPQSSTVAVTSAEIRPAPRHCPPTQVKNRLGLVVLGSGGARSGGRAASSFVVVVDGVPRILVDAGRGSFARFRETGLDIRGIDTVLLTHMHDDHVGDFGAFLRARDAAQGAPVSLRVFGPTGGDDHPATRVFVERIFGREGAFQRPEGYASPLRVDAVDVERLDHPATIAADRGVLVRAVSVEHGGVPALGFRIEHAGRSIVFSGDASDNSDALAELARSADLLVHDAAVLDSGSGTDRGYDLYAPPRRIGQIAAQAPVSEVLLTHMPSEVRLHQTEVLDSIRASYGGDVRFADDCMVVPVAQ